MTIFSSNSSATFVSPARASPEAAARRCKTPRGPLGARHHVPASADNDSCRLRLRRQSNGEQVEASVSDDGQLDNKLLLVERYQDGSAKRYFMDPSSELQTYWAKHGSSTSKVKDHENTSMFSTFGKTLKDFILPTGFPESVSDDYLDYMILQLPTNVTGWICHTLVTSSLLKTGKWPLTSRLLIVSAILTMRLLVSIPSLELAVGLDPVSGTSSAAYAASIRWVSKDGLGAIGRLFIGGRFGNLFDDDPKQWRMYADLIGSAGSIFELSTQLYPAYFLPLASLGNLTKAIARGLKDPSFRVIQNHFSVSANLGEVAAKEEVWEVVAQLFGLGIGILILDIPGIQRSYEFLVLTWLGIRLLHLWLRYQSLSALKFDTINLKRARLLVKSHVFCNTVPGPTACNKEEDILLWERFSSPRVIFSMSMQTMVGRDISSAMVNKLLLLYAKQSYILFVKQQESSDLTFYVTFKVGATSLSVLKSLWQAYWICKHNERGSDILTCLEESLHNLEDGFTDFLHQLEGAGWDDKQITLKVPKELLFDESDTSW